MTLALILSVIAASTALAVWNWRVGIGAMILMAMIQDPLRKIIPGTPGYLVLATVPILCGVIINATRCGDLSWARFKADHPALARMISVYLLGLIIPAALSATYSQGSWQLMLLGIYTQVAIIMGIMMGNSFPRDPADVPRLLAWYCVLAGLAMIGAPLERMEIGTESGLTGTASLGAFWMTQRTGTVLKMLAGFFRSPDVLGWHAATLVMFAVILAIRAEGWKRIGWAALAGWGGVALMLCARRKMFAMMIPYSVVMALLFVVFQRARVIIPVLLTAMVTIGVWSYSYRGVGTDVEVEKFYSTTLGETAERMESHGIDAVVGTIKQAGFWGYGLGMATQGSHNIRCKRPNVWQESGLSMLAAEMGVPGLVLFAGVTGVLILSLWWSLQVSGMSPLYVIYFGLVGVIVANGMAGIVSAQVFGDPFIGWFMSFLVGVVLSGARLEPVK